MLFVLFVFVYVGRIVIIIFGWFVDAARYPFVEIGSPFSGPFAFLILEGEGKHNAFIAPGPGVGVES